MHVYVCVREHECMCVCVIVHVHIHTCLYNHPLHPTHSPPHTPKHKLRWLNVFTNSGGDPLQVVAAANTTGVTIVFRGIPTTAKDVSIITLLVGQLAKVQLFSSV